MQCLRNSTRLHGFFSTRRQRSIGIALVWTDEHRSEEERARAFDVWLHGDRQTQVGSAQRVFCVRASSWDSLALVNVQPTTLLDLQMVWRHGRSSSSQTNVLGTWSSSWCERAAGGPPATRRSGSACREHLCQQRFLCQKSLEQEEMEGKVEFLACYGWKER